MRGALALVLLISSVAQAEERDVIEKAKAYFQAGVDAYDQGKYQVARDEFGHAHALSHAPALYFNMAACEEHLGHFQAAASLLRQYLIEKPDADDRTNVEQRIQSLDARDEQQHKPAAEPPAQLVAPPQPTPVIATPPRRPKLTWTWALLGVTAGAGLATIGVGAYTVTRHNELKATCGATPAGCSAAQISGLERPANATDALIAITAVAAVGTIVAAIVETRHARSHAAAPRRVAWNGAELTF